MPRRSAWPVISPLSMPMSGRNTGMRTAAPVTAMFSSVCEATCPTTSPGDQPVGADVRGHAVRDAQHQAPIDDHPHRARHRERDLALDLAERHEQQPGAQLEAAEMLHQLARLVLGGSGQERIAVKVHEGDSAAAPHHPPGGHRRIDASGQEGHEAAAGSARQPAGPGFLAEVIEGLAGHDLDADDQRRVVQIHGPAPKVRDACAERAFDLR